MKCGQLRYDGLQNQNTVKIVMVFLFMSITLTSGRSGESRLFNASEFNSIELRDIVLEKSGPYPLLIINSGKSVVLDNIRFITGHERIPYILDGIGEIKKGMLHFDNNIEPSGKGF